MKTRAPERVKSDMRKQMEDAIDEKITPQFDSVRQQFDAVRQEMKAHFDNLSKELKTIQAAVNGLSPKP